MISYSEFKLTDAQLEHAKQEKAAKAISKYIKENGVEPTSTDEYYTLTDEELEQYKRVYYAIYLSGNGSSSTTGSTDSGSTGLSDTVKEYVDKGDMYPIAYKTTNGIGEIYAYKDAGSDSYDTITVNSKGGVVWIDRNYERINFNSGFKSLNLSRVDTRNVTNMYRMFYDCSGLTSLDLSFFDTTKVTDMYDMFRGCSGLRSLDLTPLTTTNVTNMSGMFDGCSGLTSLDLSSFDTSNVTNMRYMFSSCSGLTSLNLSSFNTEKVTNMSWMFFRCSKLTSLNLSSFDTTKVTDMSCMFVRCSSLSKLTLSSSFFNSTRVTTYDFSTLTAWTDTDSLANFVSVLPTITTTKTISLSTNTQNALTDEQKTTITTKGWTIA